MDTPKSTLTPEQARLEEQGAPTEGVLLVICWQAMHEVAPKVPVLSDTQELCVAIGHTSQHLEDLAEWLSAVGIEGCEVSWVRLEKAMRQVKENAQKAFSNNKRPSVAPLQLKMI